MESKNSGKEVEESAEAIKYGTEIDSISLQTLQDLKQQAVQSTCIGIGQTIAGGVGDALHYTIVRNFTKKGNLVARACTLKVLPIYAGVTIIALTAQDVYESYQFQKQIQKVMNDMEIKMEDINKSSDNGKSHDSQFKQILMDRFKKCKENNNQTQQKLEEELELFKSCYDSYNERVKEFSQLCQEQDLAKQEILIEDDFQFFEMISKIQDPQERKQAIEQRQKQKEINNLSQNLLDAQKYILKLLESIKNLQIKIKQEYEALETVFRSALQNLDNLNEENKRQHKNRDIRKWVLFGIGVLTLVTSVVALPFGLSSLPLLLGSNLFLSGSCFGSAAAQEWMNIKVGKTIQLTEQKKKEYDQFIEELQATRKELDILIRETEQLYKRLEQQFESRQVEAISEDDLKILESSVNKTRSLATQFFDKFEQKQPQDELSKQIEQYSINGPIENC